MKTAPYDAFKAFVAAGMPDVAVLDYDNTADRFSQGEDSFLVIEEGFATEVPLDFGEPTSICLEESGEVLVHCFVRASDASSNARKFGEEIQELVRYKTLLSGSFRMFECDPPTLVSMNDGLWTKAVVGVSYSYQYFRSIET